MGRDDYKRCKACGRHADEVGTLSHSRYCGECGVARKIEHDMNLHLKRGSDFQRWRRSMAACVGGVLIDDARDGS